VTNASLIDSSLVFPKPDAACYVEDYRFAEKGYAQIEYQVTNGWLSADSKSLKDIFFISRSMSLEAVSLERLGYDPAPKVFGIPRRGVVKIILCLLMLMPMIFLLIHRMQQNNKKEVK
jgi:hypothetical protein